MSIAGASDNGSEDRRMMTRRRTKQLAQQINMDPRRKHLANMPTEIIERIAGYLRIPDFPGKWLFCVGSNTKDVKDGNIRMRLTLSALSQTCLSTRGPAERQLYRDIFINPILRNRDDDTSSTWSSAPRLNLMAVLTRRPELYRFIRRVALPWWGHSFTKKELKIAGKNLEPFFSRCPNLQMLALGRAFPRQLINSLNCRNVSSLVTTIDHRESLSLAITQFPTLNHLFLDWCQCHYGPATLPPHHLTHLVVESLDSKLTPFLIQLFAFCGSTVRHLSITLDLYWESMTESALPSTITARGLAENSALQSLHLEGLRLLSYPSSLIAQIIQYSSLLHLHLSKEPVILSQVWHILPRTLRTLTISYKQSKPDIPKAIEEIQESLSTLHANLAIRQVYLFEGKRIFECKTRLQPLHAFCANEGILFAFVDDEGCDEGCFLTVKICFDGWS